MGRTRRTSRHFNPKPENPRFRLYFVLTLVRRRRQASWEKLGSGFGWAHALGFSKARDVKTVGKSWVQGFVCPPNLAPQRRQVEISREKLGSGFGWAHALGFSKARDVKTVGKSWVQGFVCPPNLAPQRRQVEISQLGAFEAPSLLP